VFCREYGNTLLAPRAHQRSAPGRLNAIIPRQTLKCVL
jgi:hypothetical protein